MNSRNGDFARRLPANGVSTLQRPSAYISAREEQGLNRTAIRCADQAPGRRFLLGELL